MRDEQISPRSIEPCGPTEGSAVCSTKTPGNKEVSKIHVAAWVPGVARPCSCLGKLDFCKSEDFRLGVWDEHISSIAIEPCGPGLQEISFAPFGAGVGFGERRDPPCRYK